MQLSEKICRPFRKAPWSLRRKACVWFASLLALVAFAACSAWYGQQSRPESDKRLIAFTFSGKAATVCLSGNFNDWSPDSSCLKKEGEIWEIRVLLPPGRYMYGFLLDGKEWVPDPGALLQEEDGFGKKNSVLVVK
jgi:1,4-alpha-glucan branching enzyme